MPKWFSCILYNISLRIVDGTTSLSPRNSSPSWLLISSRTGQYSLMLGSASGFLLGHPVCIVWYSFFSVGWFLVSSRNCCNFSLLTGSYSTVCTTFWSSVRQSLATVLDWGYLRYTSLCRACIQRSGRISAGLTTYVVILVVGRLGASWTGILKAF